jgi:uncharacterized protein (TIGR03086 family)
MELRALMERASEAAIEVVRGVEPDQFDGPTPCPEFDVRALTNHLILWTGYLAYTAGLKQPPGDVGETYDFIAEPGWAETYTTQSAAAAQVWSKPEAWDGETGLSGKGSMPAPFIGGIILGEWLLHGWDLAVATGQTLTVDDELATALYEDTVRKAEMARQYKMFGPEVSVAESAPLLDRALGLAGRDPHWKA